MAHFRLAALLITFLFANFVAMTATQQTNVRLADGSHPAEGRVEVYINGAWGTVNRDSFDMNDANVVCMSLGYGNARIKYSFSPFGLGTGPILMDDVGCNGNEASIFDCNYNTQPESTDTHYLDACVLCRDMRLVTGTSRSYREGRLEVFYNGAWGTVCDDEWDLNDAHVVCRSMGFGDASEATMRATFGQGSVAIAFDNVQCTGSETSIFECRNNGYKTHNCGHSQDAGVRCSGNYFLDYDTTVTIDKHHLYRARNDYSQSYPEWTFDATSNYKIRFHFHEFDCYGYSSTYCYVKIGSGLVIGQSILLDDSGRSAPSDRTSTSNTAWMKVNYYLPYVRH